MPSSNRKAFSNYETAILLYLYLQTLNNGMTRRHAVECCSKKLRKMAQNEGMMIDDSYRSISGITYQMSCMEGVYKGKSKKPRLFAEIVQQYREERNEFEELLKEAEHMSEGNNENIKVYADTKPRPEGSDIYDKTADNLSSASTQDFYAWLIECQHLAIPTARSYSSAINTCDTFCKNKQIGTGRLKNAHSKVELIDNIRRLTELTEFQSNNDAQHNRLTAALKKYVIFFEIAKNGVQPEPKTLKTESRPVDSEEIARIKATLSEPRFEYGFKNDSVELSRFRESYSELNGIDCKLDDNRLGQLINNIGFMFDGKIYLINDAEKNHIINCLKKYEEQGVNVVFYSALYDNNFEEYDSEKIISSDMLKAIIKELCPHYSFRSNYFAFRKDHVIETELVRDDILRVWGNDLFQTFTDLSGKLPLIPYDKIRFVLAQNDDFLWNSHETYVCTNRINIPEDELKQITDCIEERIKISGRVSFDELPLNTLREINSQISETALINAIYKQIGNRYDRNDKVLTRKGESKDTYTAVVEYCRNVDKCTYDRLEAIAKRVSGVIRQPAIVEAANDTMVRIDKRHFVADIFVEFDVAGIDNALDQTVKDGFIGLKEVNTFANFPFCGYSWNLFLLESYCRRFSKKYMYETRRANSSNSGAIVHKGCRLSYHDLMAHAVARTKVGLVEADVFDYLTEAGYMERKRYSDIESLIREAADLRN